MTEMEQLPAGDQVLDAWLSEFLIRNGGTSGTVHLYQDGGLRLAAAANIPEKVRQIVAWVPIGKGMAGLALERGVPIQTCNLQEDKSGAVKPGARAVDAKAAVAIPVKNHDRTVRAVVGIAFAEERQFSESDLAALTESAVTLPG
jgi:L-methionine (R)-S-oxide reductase